MHNNSSDKFNDAFIDSKPVDTFCKSKHNNCYKKISTNKNNQLPNNNSPARNNIGHNKNILVKFSNATFTWGIKKDDLPSLEIEDLELESGKIMIK